MALHPPANPVMLYTRVSPMNVAPAIRQEGRLFRRYGLIMDK
jgi:hypothetical protein